MKKILLFVLTVTIFSALAAQPSAATTVIPGQIRLTDSATCTSVKDQSQSPTCWAFGTNSLFESDLIKQYHTPLNLSEMFIARYAYIDKANQFLATNGKTYCEGGGQFHDVIRVIKKYGIVPEEVYSGRPNEQLTHDHTKLDAAMKVLIHGLLEKGKTTLETADLEQVNDTLDKYLGKIPTGFMYRQKQYTPQSFAREVVKFADDYAELVSFADQPLYKKFILADKYNWANDSFYNITLSDMQMIMDTALHNGWTVGWEGDVTETGFDYRDGYASLPDSAHHYDAERLANYKTEATERDHMLQVAGIGYDENNKKWYYMKNSWGTYFSKYKGYLFMEENYFRLKTVIIFVNKKALPAVLKKKLGLD